MLYRECSHLLEVPVFIKMVLLIFFCLFICYFFFFLLDFGSVDLATPNKAESSFRLSGVKKMK